MTPVLDYLDCLYSSAYSDKPPERASALSQEQSPATEGSNTAGARSAREAELLSLYRRVLDGHRAAPGP